MKQALRWGGISWILALVAAALLSQVAPTTGQVTVTFAGHSSVQTFAVYAAPAFSVDTCGITPNAAGNLPLMVGASATCTVTLGNPVPADIVFSLAYQSCCTGSPTMTIPAGSTQGKYVVTAVTPTATLNPVGVLVSVPGFLTAYSIEMITPCAEDPAWPGCGQ